MRILVLDGDYPSDENLYGDMFVHVRVAAYQRRGHEVRVIAFFRPRAVYEFDGVAVHCAPDLEGLVALIEEFRPDVVAVHFFQGWMLRKLIERLGLRTVVWIHGTEGLWWFRRLFNAAPSREFLRYVKYNCIQMLRLRRFIRRGVRDPRRHRFVFVSDWMRRVTETDTLTRLPLHDVIANPIDPDRFPYSPKPPELRRHVLLLRSFDSRKYANDIAIKAILLLSRHAEFKDCQVSICGRGRMFAELTRPLLRFANVVVDEGFRTHEEIRALHARHGVFLCPTRQDAQGVSMCEAMCSGLVPVTSNSTAIPEFVTDGVSGFLTQSRSEIVTAILELFNSPETFSRMSAAAADEVRRKAALNSVVSDELAVLRTVSEAAYLA
jgi:glycosyltransferase involved in cell wall biosynthesis